jgi:hypothetical protein
MPHNFHFSLPNHAVDNLRQYVPPVISSPWTTKRCA